jgi:hypothetical protein
MENCLRFTLKSLILLVYREEIEPPTLELPNPILGNISPRNMIRAGRYKRLINFVLGAREAERAAPKTQSAVG